MEPTLAAKRRVALRGGTLRVAGSSSGPVVVDGEARIVGRSPGCHLVLPDKRVSAAHFEIVAGERGVRVRDLGSRNGTFYEGAQIVEAYLTEVSSLRCGNTELEFEPTPPVQIDVPRQQSFGPLVGTSPAMRLLFERLARLAPTNLSVLVLGETGTGKDLVAHAIHAASPRAKGPFVVVDCGAIPATLAESMLLGHERGAFTGAVEKRISPFIEASGGTLFLDEIGELPVEVQPKVLRALAERRVKSLGSNRYVPVDVRVIAATHRDIHRDVNEGRFRSDLFFRLAQIRVAMPPLRARPEDVPLLIEHIMKLHGKKAAFRRVTPRSLDFAQRYSWPGNVRELDNVVRAALAYDGGGPIDLSEPIAGAADGHHGPPDGPEHRPWAEVRGELERRYFGGLFQACRGSISEIARRAGVDRKTVRDMLRRSGLGA